MSIAVCTVFEGNYHLGTGALANSLCRSGYQGTLWAGYRGPLPPWAAHAVAEGPGQHRLKITDTFAVAFVALETKTHFAYYKPEWLERILRDFEPAADAAIYLDPDIVIKCPWEIFPRWVSGGIALVEDVNPHMPAGHPQRIGWVQAMAIHGLTPRQQVGRYYNSGFVGIAREQSGFLADWRRAMEIALSSLGGHDHIKFGKPTDVFHSTDQDAMNMACMLTTHPLNAAGSEAMDFATGGHYLSHAVGAAKPWTGGFIRRALRGYPPSTAAKQFLNYTQEPIAVWPRGKQRALARSLKIAAFIGRFYRRS